jgi:hypothetical protein
MEVNGIMYARFSTQVFNEAWEYDALSVALQDMFGGGA